MAGENGQGKALRKDNGENGIQDSRNLNGINGDQETSKAQVSRAKAKVKMTRCW